MINNLALDLTSETIILNNYRPRQNISYTEIIQKYNAIISQNKITNKSKINRITALYIQYNTINNLQIKRYLDLIMIQTILNYFYNNIKIGNSEESVINWIFNFTKSIFSTEETNSFKANYLIDSI